jgi:CHAD domain-containing protein
MPALTRRSELLKARLDRFSRVLHGLEQGDVRALHRARVASRRLRELLPILQLDHGTAHKLNRRLRRVTARLGTVRELDVLLLLIDELHVSRRGRSSSIGRVGVAISKARDDARKRLSNHLPISGLRRIVRKLDKLVDALAKQEDAEPPRSAAAGAQPPQSARSAKSGWRWAIEARMAKRASRLRGAVVAAGAVYLAERLHDVRIAIKKLRYAVEVGGEAMGGDRQVDLRALTRGQEILGRMHDLQMLIDRVRDVQASLAPPNPAVWRDLDAVVESLDEDCRRLHARYMRARIALLGIAERIARDQVATRSRRAVGPAEPRPATRRVS